MKKIIYIVITIIAIIFIYLEYDVKSFNIISLGESMTNNDTKTFNNYVKEYLIKNNKLKSFNDYFYNNTIKGIINDCKNNRTIRINNEEYYLKKVLRESDMVIINVGMEKISMNYNRYDMNKNYRYFNEMLNDIEKLMQEITKYAKGNILFLGYYNPTNYYDSKTDELFFDMDNKLNSIMMKYSSIYIDLYEIVKGNQYKKSNNSYLLNSYGHKKISDIIEYYLE